MTTFEPFFHRKREDHLAALGAFRRLYSFASEIGDPALEAIAILKAIQKLEQLDEEEAGRKAPRSITFPDWVRTGFWEALRTLVKKGSGANRKEEAEVIQAADG